MRKNKKSKNNKSQRIKTPVVGKVNRRVAIAGPEGAMDQLRAAQGFFNHQRYDDAIGLALELVGKIDEQDRSRYLDLHRILAFSTLQTGQYDQARRFAMAGEKQGDSCLDFLFVLAVNATKLHNFEAAIEYSRQYLALWDKKHDGKLARTNWDQTIIWKHQVLNALAVALCRTGQLKEAGKYFKQALELCPEYEVTYTNLAMMYLADGRKDKSLAILEEGLKRAKSKKEIKRFQEGIRNQITISACMIVKNEEDWLERCLSSITGLADEIILVDTGSEDRTIEIAKKFGCKIYNYPWRNDFSAARNESLRHATGDWVFIIDADEELAQDQIPRLRYYAGKEDLNILSLTVYNKSLETGIVSSFLPSIRMFRRNLNIRYEGIVHNQLRLPEGIPAARCDAKLFHYGYDLKKERQIVKLERTRKLLDDQLSEKPNDIFANFNMAQLIRSYPDSASEENSRKIIYHAERVLEYADPDSVFHFGQRVMALLQIAGALFNLKEFEKAEKYCYDALELKPDYIDPPMILGMIYFALGDKTQAERFLNLYLRMIDEYDENDERHNIIFFFLDKQHQAWYRLARLAQLDNDSEKAIEYFEKTIQKDANFEDALPRLGRLYLETGQIQKAQQIFRQDLERNPQSVPALFGLGEIYSRLKDVDRAMEYVGKASQFAPQNGRIGIFLARLLIAKGQTEAAQTEIDRLTALDPESLRLNFEAGGIFFESGDYEKAAAYYRAVLELEPENVNALNNLGNCKFRMEDYTEAAEIYEKVVEQKQDLWLAYRNLGMTRLKLNRRTEALTTLVQYAENNLDDFEILKIIGDLFSFVCQWRDAITCYERYLQHNPGDIAILYNLAEAYYNVGIPEAAVLGYKQVLKFDNNHKAAHKRLNELKETANIS